MRKLCTAFPALLAIMNAGDGCDYDENSVSVTVLSKKGERSGVTNNSVYY